jgi:hypothetical protein
MLAGVNKAVCSNKLSIVYTSRMREKDTHFKVSGRI